MDYLIVIECINYYKNIRINIKKGSANMIPITVSETPVNSGVKDESLGVDFSLFTSGAKVEVGGDTPVVSEEKKKRVKKTLMSDGSVKQSVTTEPENERFIDSYNETNGMLRGSIMQIDGLNSDVLEQFKVVKDSRTLKGKYTYLTNLAGTSAALMGSKISAIKEMNSIISNCQKLELQRAKDNKASIMEQNDDKRMMDMYQAFINTPVGTMPGAGMMITPSITDLTLTSNELNQYDITSVGGTVQEPLSPEQIRMRMEGNPNVKEVVVYDANTGNKYFDVIDSTTGQSVPNYPRSGDFLLDDTTINIAGGVARNANIDRNWPLIVIGTNGANMTDY